MVQARKACRLPARFMRVFLIKNKGIVLVTHKLLCRRAGKFRSWRDWYFLATEELKYVSETTGWPLDLLADILALTSPRISVRRNLRVAFHYLITGQWLPGVLQTVKDSVAKYELTGRIDGEKTSAFAKALRGDKGAIVMDTWVFRLMGLSDKPLAKDRRAARKAICGASAKAGWNPADFQAALWCWALDKNGRNLSYYPVLETFREFV